MPERAIISLLPALSLGFILGVLVAVTQLTATGRTIIGAVAAALVFAAGLASVVKARGRSSEKGIVALLRAGLGAALFCFIYVALLAFLGEGAVLLALAFLAGAIALALVLARVKVAPEARGTLPDGGTAPSP